MIWLAAGYVSGTILAVFNMKSEHRSYSDDDDLMIMVLSMIFAPFGVFLAAVFIICTSASRIGVFGMLGKVFKAPEYILRHMNNRKRKSDV